MDTKDVCLRLLKADSEADVHKIIESIPEMQDQNNWQPLDKRDTNFNVTSNQASDGGKALTELMTNMVDAVLMKHAFQNGVDPRSPKAPKTMYDAVDFLVKDLRGGKLVNLDPKDTWLREFAQKNLVIGITGAKTKTEGLPCYTFVDNGEGQRGEDFENTFLSLSAGNKKSIPFVQGKYNMGSSGVLRYCGRRWFKLIVSRRYDGKSDWAWTLMRRRPGDSESMPVAEYFILGETKIPSFDSDYLHPFHTMTDKRYDGVLLKTGTVVKLFDYQVGSRFLSFRGARDTLNENLVETILPFRLLDFRQLPKGKKAIEAAKKRGSDRAEGVDPRPFYGMEFLLLRSHKEEGLEDEEEDAAGEDKISVGIIKDHELGTVSVSAILLRRTIPGWLKAPQNPNRVFHSVNGQVQYKQSRGYLTRCGFPALKDRIVIVVDASNLTFSAHNDVWKGDREHISNTIVGEQYLEKVTMVIKESTALRDIQKKIAEQELERASKAESNELFQKLVDSDRNLAGLLSRRDPSIHLPAAGGGATGSETGGGEWDRGKYSPTFIRLEERLKKDGIVVPINRTRPVGARTDAENGYLNRADNPGHIIINEEVRTKFGIRQQLHDGRLIIFFEPRMEVLSIGDEFTFRLGLKDDAMPDIIESEELILRVAEEHSPPPPPPPSPDPDEHRSGEGKTDEGKGKNSPRLGLPKCILLTKDGRDVSGYNVEPWPSDFNEHDGGVIEDLGEDGAVYKVNYDNAYHLQYRLQQRGGVSREVVTEKYILGMRILMLGYEHALRALQDGSNEGVVEFTDNFRRMAARGAASTVLALAENLPKIIDRSSVEEDIE
ncbi:MAG: hypothetical protein V6Z81_07060 [Parvularculales bacterium]